MGGDYFGELAALGTAFCWTITAMSFEAAGRRVGSLSVNLIRLVMAAFFLAAYGWLTRGVAFPVDATPHAWFWLGLSGLVGFAFGDLCLFRAFIVLGSRRSMLIFSLTPLITALTGWAFLGETLSVLDRIGMALTISGVAWVISERAPAAAGEPSRPQPQGRAKLRGVLLAIGGAAGQAAGLVLSKYGMGQYDAFAATQIRVIAGIAGFGVIFFAIGWWPRVFAALKHRGAMARTSLGAVFGPFLGVSLSLVAIKYTETGVAATIMSLVPVLIIAPSVILFKDRVTARAVLGAVVAVGGVALLFLQ
ncbi:MAG: EamA family transporter [Candidatus Eisenbacteria bacterium]|nr:EamA family transporter [Candidatus Eisenbacteria bacterium]